MRITSFHIILLTVFLTVMAYVTPTWSQETLSPDSTATAMEQKSITETVKSDSVPVTHRRGPSITPVDIDDQKQPVQLYYYDKHGEKLDEPVRFLALLDTVTVAKAGPEYPLYNGITVRAGIGDLIFKIAGQKCVSPSVAAEVSLHNWCFPYLEAGIGWGDPATSKYKFHIPPSLFGKIGINYNFLYKSDPAYRPYIGIAAGGSIFNYDTETLNGDESLHHKGKALYGEINAGIQVKIVAGFALGWNFSYRIKFKTSANTVAPRFIPGYGTGHINLGINAYYSFGVKKKDISDANATL